MLRINQLKLPAGHTPEELIKQVNKILKYEGTPDITIVRRSIDARKKPELFFNYIINVQVNNQAEVYRKCDKKKVVVCNDVIYQFPAASYSGQVRPVIIGTGPAGLFCGYMLAEAGFRPVLLERGNPAEERIKDVHTFWETGKLNTESNVQFGEGGAGTFSDGKLNTLVKDKYGRNRKVLSLFVACGAPEEILYDHMPHIGTDILCKVIINMRKRILDMGGEIRFGAKVTNLELHNRQMRAVIINGKERIPARHVVLAPGHSARDTFMMLYEKGIQMEAKPFAVGMRVEHPQELINLSQYGRKEEKALGNAIYKLTAKSSHNRGVYSFCMCPGGYVVNASSEQKRLAVNGMSYSDRNSNNANSAIIISITPEDFGSGHPLAGIEFQRRIEEKAFQMGHGKIPVERYGDFKKAFTIEASKNEEKREALIPQEFQPCIKGGWEYSMVHDILPKNLAEAFVEGMEQFGKKIKGFNDKNVLVEGVESRTSSPVRIVRDKDTLQSSIKGLYPCGEGAGYAGGITSAAMDGICVAEKLARCIIDEEIR